MTDDRPTKKQRELLSFIDNFIKGNGYGPSYREVMRALDYKSVSTVAVHVDGLIARGFLRKRDHSARSLEIVTRDNTIVPVSAVDHLAWLRREIDTRRVADDDKNLAELATLEAALDILDQSDDKQV